MDKKDKWKQSMKQSMSSTSRGLPEEDSHGDQPMKKNNQQLCSEGCSLQRHSTAVENKNMIGETEKLEKTVPVEVKKETINKQDDPDNGATEKQEALRGSTKDGGGGRIEAAFDAKNVKKSKTIVQEGKISQSHLKGPAKTERSRKEECGSSGSCHRSESRGSYILVYSKY